jgi:hypothetical protein
MIDYYDQCLDSLACSLSSSSPPHARPIRQLKKWSKQDSPTTTTTTRPLTVEAAIAVAVAAVQTTSG